MPLNPLDREYWATLDRCGSKGCILYNHVYNTLCCLVWRISEVVFVPPLGVVLQYIEPCTYKGINPQCDTFLHDTTLATWSQTPPHLLPFRLSKLKSSDNKESQAFFGFSGELVLFRGDSLKGRKDFDGDAVALLICGLSAFTGQEIWIGQVKMLPPIRGADDAYLISPLSSRWRIVLH